MSGPFKILTGMADTGTVSEILHRPALSSGYAPIPVRRVDSTGALIDSVISPVDVGVFVENAVRTTQILKGAKDSRYDALLHTCRNDAGYQAFLKVDPRAKAATVRLDDVGGGIEGGMWVPYQLATISGTLLRQPMPPLNGKKSFPENTEAAVGAREYIVRRTNKRGRAAWAGSAAQSPLPDVRLNQNEIKTQIQYMVAAFKCTVFDMASANFANFLLQDNGIQAALRSMDELENDTIWYGDDSVGLFGVLNHPFVPRYSVATVFSASADSATMAAALLNVVNGIITQNFTTFTPTDIVMDPNLYSFLSQTFLTIGTANTAVPVSLLEWLASKNMAGIPMERIRYVQELTGRGPGGTAPLVVYGKDPDATRIISTGGPQALPVQYSGVDVTQIYYKGSGGLNMYNPANNAIAFFTLG